MRVPLPSSLFPLLAPALLVAQQPVTAPPHFSKLAHTYSIVAWDSVTGDLGVAVESKFPNVGGIVPWAEAGVGAVATQSLSNTAFGEKGLELIAMGASAEEAMRIVMRSDTMLQDRQVGMVDARGNAASFTGTRTFDWAGGRVGKTGNARWHARRQGRGDRGPRLRRAGQHHGVRPDGEEPGRDIRADEGRPEHPAHGRAQGGPGRRWRQARHAVGRAARRAEERRLSRRERPIHRHPGLRRRRPDRRARAAARPARALLLSQPAFRPDRHFARHRRRSSSRSCCANR